MRILRLRPIALFLLTVCLPGSAAAGTVSGVIRNGTTGKPAANAVVTLLALQGNMDTVADTKSDAQGRYRLENAAVGVQPMLIRVVYKGVQFHASLPPGRDTADIEVFDPTSDPKSIQVASRVVVFQPDGSTLLVGEEYTVRNNTKPPLAFYKNDGNFEFQLPEGAELAQVSAWGPSGMPTVQGTMDRTKNRYAIAFPLRPGENGVRLSYKLPYAGNKADLKLASPYAAGQVTIVAPPSIQVSGTGLQPAGTSQGMSLYAHDAIAANAAFEVGVSGTAPPPSAATRESSPRDTGDAADTSVPIQTMPQRLDSLKWVLAGGFAAIFLLGALFLWRRPVPATLGLPSAIPPARPAGPRVKSPKTESVAARVPAAETSHGQGDRAVAEVEREVTHSLDELKDTLFRLELRRQAGTISEDDYARERSRAEKILRDLVRG